MTTPAIRLSTLGRVECTANEGELHALTAQPRRIALLIYLALADPRGFHSRDQLLTLFWPDHDEQRGRNALSQALHFIRRSVAAEAVVNGADDQLRVDSTLVWCDVTAFEDALAAGRTADALALYRGPFLEGFHVSAAAAELDHWIDGVRDRCSRLYARALQTMAQDSEAARDFTSAVAWYRKLASHDPLSSRAALGLMQALAAAGEPESALRHARVYETLSREELGAPPAPAITAFVKELQARTVIGTANGNRGGSATNGVRQELRDLGQPIESLAAVNPAARTISFDHRRWQTVVAIGGVLAASLASVAIARRGHTDATAPIDCVAILPMQNLSGDPRLDYFADAMTEAATTDLEMYRAPEVRPRSSVLAYRGSSKPVHEIGRALKCDGIVETSLTRTGNIAHIDAKILYAPGDRHLWAESYEEDTSRMLILERVVILGVVRHVRALAARRGSPAPRRRVDPLVYSVYQQGRDAFRSWNALSVRQAVGFYQQAIATDSTFAPAYAGLADAYDIIGWQGYGDVSYLDSARALANRALALDSASSEAHATRGFILTSDGDWRLAEAELTRAIALDENNALAHHWYAVLLAILNRKEEALAESRRASELDPKSQEIQGKRQELQYLAGVKVPLGNPAQLRGLADPTHPAARAVRAINLARTGKCPEAYEENLHAQEFAPNNTIVLVGLVLVHQACKDSSRAKTLLAQLERRPDAPLMGVYFAMGHVAAQQPDSAFAWLDRSRWGAQTYYVLRANGNLAPLRSDPRFGALLRRLHMPT